MSFPYAWNFTTEPLIPPVVIANSPTGTGVPLASQIIVNFSKAMNQTSAQSSFVTIPTISGSFSWIGNNMIYTPSNLAYNTMYNVTIE